MMRQLVEEILATVADPLVLVLKRCHRFPSVVTAFLPPGKASLKYAQLSLFHLIPARIGHLLARARGKQAGNANIHTNILSRLRQRCGLDFTDEAGVPLVGPARNANRLDRA